MPIYTQAHQIIDKLNKDPLADITDMLDDYVQGQLAKEDQDKTAEEIREDFWQMWRKQADCSRLQARIALKEAGMFDTVQAFIDSENASMPAKEAWAEAYRFSRKSQLFDAIGPALGMTPEQIDDLFRAAQAVEV